MYGSPASRSSAMATVVRGICIRLRMPSCIRAPPAAVKTTNGARARTAASAPDRNASPTPSPIDPPMKAKFCTATTAGSPPIVPCATTIASGSPVVVRAVLRRST